MSLRRYAGVAFIVIVSCMFWFNYSLVASSSTEKEIENKQNEQGLVYYRLHETVGTTTIPVSVFLNGKQVLTLTETAGGLTPRERAAILVDKLKVFIDTNANPDKILPGYLNGTAVIKYEKQVLFTADVKNARALGMGAGELAMLWTNNLRQALGAGVLLKDFELFKLISENITGSCEYQETGMASWYGNKFHGRRCASGYVYDMNQFTAAHKSLPFGSIVKVTNLRNNNSCVVKITDRGPFVKGRIIDLSRVAAEEIDMVGSGTSKVKIELLGKM